MSYGQPDLAADTKAQVQVFTEGAVGLAAGQEDEGRRLQAIAPGQDTDAASMTICIAGQNIAHTQNIVRAYVC